MGKRLWARTRKPVRLRTDVLDEAIALVKAAGFEFVAAAHNRETVYYRWPGREEQLRLSLHGRKGTRHPQGHLVIASVSFGVSRGRNSTIAPAGPHEIRMSEQALFGHVASAIGRYFLKSGPNPSEEAGL